MSNQEYTKAYGAGKDAFQEGESLKDCPYDSRFDGDRHRAWCKGYVEAECEYYAMG